MKPYRLLSIVLLALISLSSARAVTNLSDWAIPGKRGRLLTKPDRLGNKLLDYSAVGYRNGLVPIPEVPVKVTISPVAGDDGASIQAAINQVKALPLDTNGFRGAVLLNGGEYDIGGSITIDGSGVVLRGVGDGATGTVLRATGTNQRSLVIISGSGSASTVSGTTHNITNAYVPVGARSFSVDSTSGLAVGDRVFVRRVATAQWITEMGMDLLCCPPDSYPWDPADYHIDFDRIITRIEGNRIMIDAPITCAIEARFAGGTIRKFTWAGRINNVGVEDIRGVSDYASATDEAHGWTFVHLDSVENAWVQRVTSQFFGYSCVSLSAGARTVTVRDCRSLDPISIIDGGRRYAFVMDDAQLCLVQNCYTLKDRHQFVTQSKTTGPNVFVDGLSDTAYSDAGPHHRWGTGALWDNIVVNGNNLNVQNRGNLGTGHGWAGGNEVVWNCDADGGFVVQNPPGARNWLIGSIGNIENGTVYVGPHAPGTYDSHGSNVFPNSIYYAQLQDRLAASRIEFREYAVGEINSFVSGSPTGSVVSVDVTWRSAIQAEMPGALVAGFDIVTNNQVVPFTFTFNLGSTSKVVGATLALALRSMSATATNEVLYLDNVTNTVAFSELGWLPIATGTNASVCLLDLADHLGLLTDGKLNLAVKDTIGIDWATLELQIAPNQVLYTNVLPPVADAYVRGGTSATLNFGSAVALDVKADSSADTRRQAHLRWDLSGLSSRVQHARIRLTPTAVGYEGLEHGAALVASNAWSEDTLTWNNQPVAGKRFATWIPSTGVPVEFVVTPQVQEALASDGVLSLQIASLRNVGASGLASYASREAADSQLRPQLLLVYSNPVPVISAIGDQTIPVSTNTGPIPFVVSDSVYAPNLLTPGAVSDNASLVNAGGFAFGGALSNRTLTVTPLPGQFGTALITVIVTNPAGMTASSQFTLSVTNLSGATGPASGVWIRDGNGDWNSPVNWSSGVVATGIDMAASFAIDATGPRFINNNSPRTIGDLVFSDADPFTAGEWYVTNNSFILQVSNGSPAISVSNTVATLGSIIAGTQGLTKQGGGTLLLTGANSYGGLTTVSAGALRIANGSGLGAVAGSCSIGNDATARLELTGNITVAEPITLSCKGSAVGNVPAIVNVGGTNTLLGPLSLTTGGSYWTLEPAAGKLLVSGTVTNITTSNVRTVWLRGAAEGAWLSSIGDSAAALSTAVRKDDSGTWTLAGDNRYTGTTTVSNGTLMVDGVVRGAAINIYGGTLGGTGLIAAPVTLYPGAVFSPGRVVGSLAISNNLTLSPGSFTDVQLNAQTTVSDRVLALSNVVYSGTLRVTNLAGTLQAGQAFQLFNAMSASGNFSNIQPVPGPNLLWKFRPAEGVLEVMAAAPPVFTQFAVQSGTQFNAAGIGPASQPYRVLATTNPALPASSWLPIGTGVFSGGVFSFSDAEVTNQPRRFYRVVTP